MNLIEQYIEEMELQNQPHNWLFDDTTVTWIEPLESGEMSLRFETRIYPYQFPICQYVIYCDGKFIYRDEGKWFIPGDFLFDDFGTALDTLRGIRRIAENYLNDRT
jgi:hypothetical protein